VRRLHIQHSLLSSVKSDDVNQITEGKVSPDPTFVFKIDLTSGNPLVPGPLSIGGSLIETNPGLVPVRASSRVRVVRILGTGFPV
jgi:hypothetical protein